MDTDSVRLFILSAEKLNISAAGRALEMAPAVASAKLAKLERTLGADLLHRSTRKVALSLEGAEFLPYARDMIAQEDAARAALGQGSAAVNGTLRFAAPSTFAQLYIVPILPDFMALHPGITLDCRLSDAQFDLIDGSFDLALRAMVVEDTSLKGRKLADDTRVLCASPAYLERWGVPQKPEDLAAHRLLAFRDRLPRRLIAGDGGTGVFDPQASDCRLVLDDGASHRAATLASAGISANSLWSVSRELRDGTLIRVLPEYELDDDTALWLFYPRSNVLTAKVRVFIDFLLDRIGKSPEWVSIPRS